MNNDDRQVQLWLALLTQWHYAAISGARVGLRNEGVDVVMFRLGYSYDGPDLFRQLQAMKRVSLEYWARE